MINPINSQGITQAWLTEVAKQQPAGLLGFPMQNLISLADDPSAPASSRERISLTAQSFANIITKSITQALQGVIATFADKIMQLAATMRGEGVLGTSVGTTGSTQVSNGAATGAEGGSQVGSSAEGGGFWDKAKDFFGSIGQFFFGQNGGISDILRDILWTVLPSLGSLKIGDLLGKFGGIGETIQGLWTSGKEALGGLFERGRDALSNLWEKGKAWVKRIF